VPTASSASILSPLPRRRSVPLSLIALLGYSGALVLFLVAPLVVLLARTASTGDLLGYLTSGTVVEALRLSLLTTLLTLGATLVLGTPVAYVLARYRFPGRNLLDTLLELPMVLPPAVAGVALLITLGRRGALGPALSALGIEISFTTAAVVLAQLFVAAPFYVKAAQAGFESVDAELEHVSASLGVSGPRTFWQVTVPLALPALLGGAVMTWARALGEFGATIMFAGNFVGKTQTMPLAIYVAMERDLGAALVLAGILVLVSFAVLVGFKALARSRYEAVA
jgi:molybdate transport system permease protein